MSKIQDVCVSFWLASPQFKLLSKGMKEIIDHRKLGEHLAELLESRAKVKEKTVHKRGSVVTGELSYSEESQVLDRPSDVEGAVSLSLQT